MTTRIWHPEIAADPLAGDGFATVDDASVPQLRQSGWLLATERDEHLERVAAHPSQNRPDDEDQVDDPGKGEGESGTKAAPHRKGAGTTAGGKAGTEGGEQ